MSEGAARGAGWLQAAQRLHRFTGSVAAVIVEDAYIDFDARNVLLYGPDFFGEFATDTGGRLGPGVSALGESASGDTEDLTETAADDYPGFFLRIQADFLPLVLRGKTRDLIAGVDFEPIAGFIRFFSQPSDDFDNGPIPVLTGVDTSSLLGGYSQSTDAQGVMPFVSEYLRTDQSIASFKRALAEACGIFVSPTSDRVLKVIDGTYVLTGGKTMVMGMPHEAWTEGRVIARGETAVEFRVGRGPVVDFFAGVTEVDLRFFTGGGGTWDPTDDNVEVTNEGEITIPGLKTSVSDRLTAYAAAHLEDWEDAFGVSEDVSSTVVNLGDVIDAVIGARAICVRAKGLTADQRRRAIRFMDDFRPLQSCILFSFYD